MNIHNDINENFYHFDCGCKIPIYDDHIRENDNLPSLEIPFDDIAIGLNYNITCPEVWKLLATGNTKGVFQLETNLGQSWSKRLQPDSIEEMSALISIIRPGTLRSMIGNKSATQHYVDRKHQIEPNECDFEIIKDILDPTYNILVYQEQSIQIASKLAGFSESEADILRKAIGKKKADLMAKVKKVFLKGCAETKLVNEITASAIFDWIEKSNRYAFNHSHGIQYGMIGYQTAWVKHHFPLHFYAAYIKNARSKQKTQDEVKELVADAKLFYIDILPPSVETIHENHSDMCIFNNRVHFGLKSIKKLGSASIKKLLTCIEDAESDLGISITKFSWLEILCYILPKITSVAANGLICVGLFDKFGMSRKKMLLEYQIFQKLSKKETETAIRLSKTNKDLNNILLCLVNMPSKEGGPMSSRIPKIQDLIKLLDQPMQSTKDNPKWILTQERELLGVPISYNLVQTIDHNFIIDTTCKEFIDGKSGTMTMGVEILRVNTHTIKNGNSRGKEMAFLSIEDETCLIDAVVFNDCWEENNHKLYQGNTVALVGVKSDRGSFVVEKVYQI